MQTIVCFGDDWGRHPSTLQFLARQLAKRYQIVWIESLGLRYPRLTLIDFRRVLGKLMKWWRGPATQNNVSENLVVLTPMVLPFHRNPFVRLLNRLIIQRALNRLRDRQRSSSSWLVVTMFPYIEYLLGHLGEGRSVYYCVDELSEFPGMNPAAVRELEEKLLRKVNVVIVTSAALLSTKRSPGKRTQLLRHGVDFEAFSSEGLVEASPPLLIRDIPRPVFGYHGCIQEIIDFDLIATVAQRRPEWSFVFIGAQYGEVSERIALPNIHYLPVQPYSAMPSVVAHFDVGIIPYRLDERTRNCNPIKLREYLAAGKPVLSTRLPEVMMYADVVAFANTPDEFVTQGERLLRETGPEYRQKRMDRVRQDSWEAVAAKFIEFSGARAE